MSLLRNVIRTSKNFKCVSYFPSEPLHTGFQRFNNDRKFKAFKAKQAKMQCDDGYPVHLKGGIMDKILYHVTVGGCVIGVAQSFWFFYLLVQK